VSDAIISVEKLSKRYVLGHQVQEDGGLRHALEKMISAPAQWLRNRQERKQAEVEEFWALKEVSFEIRRGEVVGIIGRNGAGKSTLLKILSRITEPTSGRITLDGRVASLLEVGTGFHQELTGRENIFLNGAILGMSKAEIKRKFDEIVAFSEVERFLDTPVKRYSSGMYVRLAFAVAAHLEPEILVVDEVLAVGDAAFQKKCLGKMQEVAKNDARTVLFVSHNMAAVRSLCTKCILLNKGQVEANGDSEPVTKAYLTAEPDGLSRFPLRKGNVELQEVKLTARNENHVLAAVYFLEDYVLKIRIGFLESLRAALIIAIYNDEGLKVSSINSFEEGLEITSFKGAWEFAVALPGLCLMPGSYRMSLVVCDQHTSFAQFESVLLFGVEPKTLPGASLAYNRGHGVTRISGGIKANPV
jgi:lipopolysaccharide transport system ATP-binding protein